MKKNILAILLIGILVFTFTACGKKDEEPPVEENVGTEQNVEESTDEVTEPSGEEPTELVDTYDFEKKVDELNNPATSEERKEELLEEIQAILEQVEKQQQ